MKFLKPFFFAATVALSVAAFANERIGGVVTGFEGLKKDDILDGAVVVPTLRPAALLAFQFENLLGPSEQMSAGPTTVEVPGNFFFPKQKENYGIFPITLTKENFGLYLKANQSEELHALSFQAPFSKLVDMAKNKKPFTQLLPYLRLKKASFAANQNWRGQTNVKMALDRVLTPNISYTWNRKAGTTESADMILVFQSTPAERWAVSDINGQAAAQGSLNRIQGLGLAVKAFFLRVFTKAGEQNPYAVVGQVRTSDRGTQLQAGDLPERIENVRMEGTDQVAWNPIEKQGWLSVIRSGGGKTLPLKFDFPMGFDLSLGIKNLMHLKQASEWIRPNLGSYKFSSPLATGESVLVVFVGTSRPVSAPSVEDNDPDLFTYAEEIRMANLKK